MDWLSCYTSWVHCWVVWLPHQPLNCFACPLHPHLFSTSTVLVTTCEGLMHWTMTTLANTSPSPFILFTSPSVTNLSWYNSDSTVWDSSTNIQPGHTKLLHYAITKVYNVCGYAVTAKGRRNRCRYGSSVLKGTLHTVNTWWVLELSLLLIPLTAISHHHCPLYSSNTPRVFCSTPGGFIARTTAISLYHQTPAFPMLVHSSSLRIYLSKWRVFRTAHTSSKEHIMQLHQNT